MDLSLISSHQLLLLGILWIFTIGLASFLVYDRRKIITDKDKKKLKADQALLLQAMNALVKEVNLIKKKLGPDVQKVSPLQKDLPDQKERVRVRKLRSSESTGEGR